MRIRGALISPLVVACVMLSVSACGSSEDTAAPVNREAAGTESESTLMTTTLCISGGSSAGPLTVQWYNNVANVGTSLDYLQCGRTEEAAFNVRITISADIFDSSGNKVMELRASNPQLEYPFVAVSGGGKSYEYGYSVGEGKTYSIDGYSVEIQRFPDDENSKQFRVWID